MTHINTFAVRVVTSSDFLAGTDNDVYFDVGPLGWKLSSSDNDFERGSDRTYDLDLHGLALDTDDLVWMRLQKKGDLGIIGTPDIPDGEWRPERIYLIVNGQEFVSQRVDVILHNDVNPLTSRPQWFDYLSLYRYSSAKEIFARSLRMLPNNSLGDFDESVAALTTPLKHLVMGWLETNLPRVTAIGTVLQLPNRSSDGLATIDLRLEAIELDGSRYFVDGRTGGIPLQRYIRVEYQFRRSFPLASDEADVPANGQRMRISGEVKWDSDQEGWYEIWPAGRGDLEWLDPPSKITHLTSRFSEVNGPPETGVVHWPGCNVKGAPKEWEQPRDFKFEKVLVNQLYEISAVVENPAPNTVVVWTWNGHRLAPGEGTFQSGTVLVNYRLKGLILQLWNQPEGGTTSFDLRASIDDTYQPTSRGLNILFDGIRITYEPDYYRIAGGCQAAKEIQNQRFKTAPQAIPHYDPASLAQLDHGVLVSFVDKIAREHGLSTAWRDAAQVADKGQVVETLLGLCARYPVTAGKVMPGRLT